MTLFNPKPIGKFTPHFFSCQRCHKTFKITDNRGVHNKLYCQLCRNEVKADYDRQYRKVYYLRRKAKK